MKKQFSRLFSTLSEVFSAFWSLAHSSVLRRYFLGFGLSFSPKVLVPFRYMEGSIFRVSPRRQQQNLWLKVLRTSGFFRILRFLLRLRFLYCGRKAELGRNGHVDVPMVLQKEYAISRLNFLACLDLQGVDQSAVAKFLPNFYPYRESLIALFREVPNFHSYGFDFLFFPGSSITLRNS